MFNCLLQDCTEAQHIFLLALAHIFPVHRSKYVQSLSKETSDHLQVRGAPNYKVKSCISFMFKARRNVLCTVSFRLVSSSNKDDFLLGVEYLKL